MLRRSFIVVCAMAALSACAGPPPKTAALDAASRDKLQITQVTVDVSKIGAKTQGRPVAAADVKSHVTQSANAMLRNHGSGPRQARAELTVDSANVITAGQSMLIGGESIMSGTVALVDVKTGAQIMPATEITSGGGGWAGGGLIAVATRDDATTEVRQMSQEFVSRARILVFGK